MFKAVLTSKLRHALGAAVAGALMVASPARALDPDKPLGACTVEVWGARKGLPSSFVRAIAQTPDGYLWIAGYGGVGRYDGARIVSVPQPNQLAHLFDVQSLKVDRLGALWLISSKGLPICVRDGVARDCLPATVKLPPGERLVDAHPGDAQPEDDGSVGLLSRTGLWRYRPGPPPRLESVAMPGLERAAFLHRDRRGRQWVGGDTGLYLAGKDGVFAPVIHAGTPLTDPARAYFETPQGRLWFLFDRMLLRIEGDQMQGFVDGGAAASSRGNQVIEDRDGNVWIGSGTGLTRFRDGRWLTFTTRDGLPDDDVTALYEDREGSLWVGTRNGGVAQFTDRVVAATAGPRGLSIHRRVTSVAQDRTGTYWFGSPDGLVRWRGQLNQERNQDRVYTDRDGLPDRDVLAVMPGRTGETWIGTSSGLARVRGNRVDVPAPVTGAVAALHLGDDGALWVGADQQLLRWQDGRLDQMARSSQGPIRSIEADGSGQIWVASNLGVARLQAGRLLPVVLPGGDYPGRALHRDREGRLWAATGTDLARLAPGPVQSLGLAQKLGGRQLFQIVEDDRGSLWLGTSRGLVRLSKAQLAAVADGQRRSIDLLSLETDDRRRDIVAHNTRDPGAWKDAGGRLWFGTERGVLMVDPARLRVNDRPPAVRIEEATADARPLGRGVDNNVPPGAGNLTFRFSAITLLEPHKSLHRYRLEGFDDVWVEAGDRRVAQYTNIPPGAYRFHVQGSNADGVWNQAGDVIAFRLRPHFYQTAWFYAAATLAALLVLVLLWRQRVRGLRREYLGALAERSRVARELHDTLLQGMSAAALRLRGLRRRLGADADAARDLEAIDSLVVTALQETRQFLGGLRGQDGAADLALALARLANRLTENRQIACAVVVEGQAARLPDEVKGDLFRIAQEAIHNAVKHAGPRRIEVKLRYEPRGAALTVADDGCGFEQSAALGAADGHFGLVGMRERATRVGDFRLTSRPGQGTTVEVRVSLPDAKTC